MRECNICCYNGNHNNVGYTGSRAQTGVPGWGGGGGSTREARIINVTNRTVFVHSFTGSSTYTTALSPTLINCTMYSTISMKYKQLYHILDYGQHLSCGGRNGCGICNKKRRKKFKHALFTQIQLNFVWFINTFPTWCIVNNEFDPLARVHS